MTYPPIYHLRCNGCHTSYLSVSHDCQAICFTCGHVDWQALCVWTRDRTPWVDAPGDDGERIFPLSTPAGFLERLRSAMLWQKEHPLPGTVFVAPGLWRTITWIHGRTCQLGNGHGGLCDADCRDEVTYARVAAAPN